jgi:cold-inducible RNA-binding protein
MAKKLYVGNLSYQTTEDDLSDAFSAFGEVVSSKIVMDTGTGRSKGFGFVEMKNDEDAEKAITSLNETSFMERTINVSEARPQRDRGGANRQREFERKGSGGKKPNNFR